MFPTSINPHIGATKILHGINASSSQELISPICSSSTNNGSQTKHTRISVTSRNGIPSPSTILLLHQSSMMTRSVTELVPGWKRDNAPTIANGMAPIARPEATGRRSEVFEIPRQGRAEVIVGCTVAPAGANTTLPAMVAKVRFFFRLRSSARRKRRQDW